MKKLAILSPLVLLATTALAQDSTCILQPSCSQLGYTSAEADCGSQKVLRCPFDVSQVACLSTGSDSSGGSGGGDDGSEYNPNDPNNELEDAIILEIEITANEVGQELEFRYAGGNIIADCGNGEIVKSGCGDDTTARLSCTYEEAGKYTLKLRGDFTYFDGFKSQFAGDYGIYSVVSSIIKLDKRGIKKMSRVCGSRTYGFIPPLPSGLTDGDSMFYGCNNLSGVIRKLPSGLTNGAYMFDGAGVTGNIPPLPSGLTNGNRMFRGSDFSGTIPELPSGLTNADYMFGVGYYLTGTPPTLPESLISAEKMFINSSNLSGVMQDFSTLPNLTTYTDMFSGTGITQADNPTWPAAAW